MERLHILIAVLDRDTVTETDAFCIVIKEPLCSLTVDKQPLVFSRICLFRERRELVRTVDDDNGAVLQFAGASIFT